VVGVLAERHAELRGEHHVLAPSAGERLADDQLRLTPGVGIGGVDEIDSGVQRAVNDLDSVVVVGVAGGAEHHRAEAQLADGDAGASQGSVIHGELLGWPRVNAALG
jgi:hypothetical protein